MNPTDSASNPPLPKSTLVLLWSASVIFSVLLSPKWTVPLAAWVAPAGFLLFVKYWPGRRKWLLLFCGLLISQLIALYEVIPAPDPVFLIIVFVGSALAMIPYLLQHEVGRRSSHFLTTVVFPALCVSMEFMDSKGASGVWSSRANSQFEFSYLAQLASITGLWGISFFVTWFNATLAWCVERRLAKKSFKRALIVHLMILLVVITFAVVYSSMRSGDLRRLMIGGVTVPQFIMMELMSEELTGKNIKIDPQISQTSETLQDFNKAFLSYIENPDTARVPRSTQAIRQQRDSLFYYTLVAANKGAKIVSWSEASTFIFPEMEQSLLRRGEQVAAGAKIYLLMTYAVLYPGKVYPGKKFMENKAVLIGPDGRRLNEFYKNKPVPMAESSVSGDGKIPVIKTPFGRLSVSICYDADFPDLMKQLSDNRTDLLLLPSGDWYAISPFHSYMAAFRGIENGTPIFRQVSGGLSFVSSPTGKVEATKNFYRDQSRYWVTEITTGHTDTLYSRWGDWVAYLCVALSAMAVLWLVFSFARNRWFS